MKLDMHKIPLDAVTFCLGISYHTYKVCMKHFLYVKNYKHGNDMKL